MLASSLLFDKKIHTVHSKYEVHDAFNNPSTKPLWILKPTFYNRVQNLLFRGMGFMYLARLAS